MKKVTSAIAALMILATGMTFAQSPNKTKTAQSKEMSTEKKETKKEHKKTENGAHKKAKTENKSEATAK